MIYRSNKSKGISIFIAVAIMSVLLLVSYAVTQIALKGTQFATSGRDSQFAFYAADTGLECAIYWDVKFDKFATSTPGNNISCGNFQLDTGESIPSNQTVVGTTTLTRIGGGGNANPVSVFGFNMNQGGNAMPYCTIVTVYKYYQGANLMTYIKSRGYNTCDPNNPRRVERGIEVTY
jgi:hypothetical protein